MFVQKKIGTNAALSMLVKLITGCTNFTAKGVNASTVCLCETDMCNDQACQPEKVNVSSLE